jgi:hypothetical protein
MCATILLNISRRELCARLGEKRCKIERDLVIVLLYRNCPVHCVRTKKGQEQIVQKKHEQATILLSFHLKIMVASLSSLHVDKFMSFRSFSFRSFICFTKYFVHHTHIHNIKIISSAPVLFLFDSFFPFFLLPPSSTTSLIHSSLF